MIEKIHALIEALRVKSPNLPDGFAVAPILDSWEFKLRVDLFVPANEPGHRGLTLTGRISNDNRFPGGHIIHTTDISEIDGRTSIRWARTRNTLYRLGAPALPIPLTGVALATDWTEALTLLAVSCGEHTLDEPALNAITKLLDLADSQDWPEKRRLAREISAAMGAAERFSLRDAWTLLGADPREKTSAGETHELLALLLFGANDEERQDVDAVLAAWKAFAGSDASGLRDENDHIAAAHKVGHSLVSSSRNQRPLFVRMALSRNWMLAAHLLRDEVPLPDRIKLNASDLFSVEWPKRREAARLLEKHFEEKSSERSEGDIDAGLAKCCELLAVNALDPSEAAWVAKTLRHYMTAGKDNDEDALLAGWQRIAGGRLPKSDDHNDPFALAWIAAAERSAGRVELDDAPEHDKPEPDQPVAPEPPGIIVLARLGGTTKSTTAKEVEQEFRAMVGKRLPLALARNVARVRTKLSDEFPHLTTQLDPLMTGLVEGEPIRMPPTLLLGAAGTGKTRLARRVAEELHISLHRYDGSGSADNAFGGTPRRWSSGEHCTPLEAVRRGMISNPLVLVDEIDKIGSSKSARQNGSLDRALLPFLDSELSRNFPDPYVQGELALQFVNYILTANDATVLSAPLRDRLRIVALPYPTIEHLPQLARSLVADIAEARGGDPRWFPMLEDYELAIAEALWRGGSLRRLRAVVERILALREQNPRN